MIPASPRQDGERSPNGLPVGGSEMLPVAGPVTRLREVPVEDPDEDAGDAQRRREADQWLRRRLLERQLHDGASLRISALALRLGLLRDQAPFDEADWENRIGQLQDELHAVLQELRDVAGKIYPPLLDQAGLGPAIREEADRLGAALEIEVAPEVGRRRFGPVAEGAAYFALAECLAAPPDDAPQPLRVHLSRDGDDLVMVVSGVGARHLRFLLDQARPLGGTADLAEGGTPETGTITVRIPCE